MATISTFLRAIRAGAVHIKHSAILLAHYGRLGPAFDLCTKVVIDVLREEGMYNENGQTVVDVILQAIQEVCHWLASWFIFVSRISLSRSASSWTLS